MSIIPAAVHICLRAEADDQPKGPSVVTPCVGVGLGRGMLDHHHRVNLSERLVSGNRGRGAEEGNIDQEEQHCSNDRGGAHSSDSVTNKRTGTTMVLLVAVMVAPTMMGRLEMNKRTGTTMVLLVAVMVAPTMMGRLVMNEHTAM